MRKKSLIGLGAVAVIAIVAVLVATNQTQPPSITQTYTLTIHASPPGACWGCPSGGQYEAGRQLEIDAAPTAGYTFDHWSGDASGTSASVFITMDSDKVITATSGR